MLDPCSGADQIRVLNGPLEEKLGPLKNRPAAEEVPGRADGESRSFDARDGTLDAVMASGKLSVIADPRLRDLLVEWKGRVEDAGEEARDLRAVSQRVAERNAQLGWTLATHL